MKCTKCVEEKTQEEFFFKNKAKGIRSTVCKVCQRSYKIKYYNSNKQSHYDRNKITQGKIKEYILGIKSKGCTICDEASPECIDFHHLDPKQKEDNISGIHYFGSLKRAVREMEKCIPVCANCHRKIHAGTIDAGVGNW
jgi:hypothetical protein